MRRRAVCFYCSLNAGACLALGLSFACNQYAAADSVPDAPEGGASGGIDAATPPPPDVFVPEQVPAFHPSFESDAGPDDVTVPINDTCPDLPEPHGGALSGTFKYAGACFSRSAFLESFGSFCEGISVNGRNAVARVNGTIDATDSTAVRRNGQLWFAVEFVAPCRGPQTCDSFAAALQVAFATSTGGSVQNACYATTPDACTCQMEYNDQFNGKKYDVDVDAGTWGNGKFVYGLYGNMLKYTGLPRSTPSAEQAMSWSLIR